ncbi:hypothetical protein [Thermococcus thioreducens]|uniref:DUF7982 domain-containing protein n=2 Tax=Thermococcus thioreducens TaxID=277988 RepID=A0A1I0NS25_9EURY|nr:hypothetical protein [Thermococcus thioreducens]ASJ11568.1 hypothetical protein A3L14_01085 [Thermococcus thioreducens]SEW04308.1 hypothetical protein SAMN05216170_1213 [Thermococcus thioreducens]
MVVVSVGKGMETKDIIGGALVVSGGVLALHGFLNALSNHINLGVAGMFLGAVILTFKPSSYVKRDALRYVTGSYERFFESFVRNLHLEGNAVYIPPFENLPEGGIFVPLHERFELDLARLDTETVFLTDVPNDRAMGLFLGPIGLDLLKRYEEHLEYPLRGSGPGTVESAAGAVLKALGLASRVYIEGLENGFRVVIQPDVECSPEICEKIACPVCSSILLALARATGEVLYTRRVEEKDYGIEIEVERLGGVEEWM